MLMVLSPSKTLATEPYEPMPVKAPEFTQASLLDGTAVLAGIMRDYTPALLQKVMGISPKLAELNMQRYQRFTLPFTAKNARPALFTFKGDVYDGLDAASFTKADCLFAQRHLRIVSGLYGLLRPLDLMQPYRLEMGIKLRTPLGSTLYDFWNERITEALNTVLKQHKTPVLLNLASQEYFAAVKPELLVAPVVSVDFKQEKKDGLKTIALFAKQARGMMASYVIRKRIDDLADIKYFALADYRFQPALSTQSRLVFAR